MTSRVPPANGTVLAAGRNAPCPCGSGRKFKHCCGRSDSPGAAVAASAPMSPSVRMALTAAARARSSGDLRQALSTLERAAATEPSSGALALALGSQLHEIGRTAEAMPWLDRAVAAAPDSAEARLAQGRALEALGWPVGAAEAYQHAASLAPRLPQPQALLGAVLLALDERAEAAQAFRRAAQLAPATPLGRLCAAYALIADGATDAAIEALKRVVAIDPRQAQAHGELGKLLAETGDSKGARAAFETVLRLDPRAVGRYYDLVRIERLPPDQRPLLARMHAAARLEGLPDMERVLLDLAIGRAHDDFDEPEAAMRHFVAAARRAARVRPLDRELITRRVDTQVRIFPSDFFVGRGEAAAGAPVPLLIVGMPRSGTTLVESMLARHAEIGAAQELPFWHGRAPVATSAGALPDDQSLHELAHEYLATLRRHGGERRYVTDKKPDNFFWLGLVAAALPQARFVHCRRHPLDTCVSVLANHFVPRPDFSPEPEALVFYWREYERLMDHWRQVLPAGRLLEIDYEDLVTRPEPVMRGLLAFLDLPFDAECLHPEAGTRRVSTASLWQVRQPIGAGSVQRWRRYEPWLGPLRDLLDASAAGARG